MSKQRNAAPSAAENEDGDKGEVSAVLSVVAPIVAPMLLMQGLGTVTGAVYDGAVGVKHALIGKSDGTTLAEYQRDASELSYKIGSGLYNPERLAAEAADFGKTYAGTVAAPDAAHLLAKIAPDALKPAAAAATQATQAAAQATQAVPTGAGGTVLATLVKGVKDHPTAVAVVALHE